MRSALLIAGSMVLAIASWGVDRFGHELCHRGLPLGFLMVALPFAGVVCAVLAMLMRRSRWFVAIGAGAIMLNGYYAVIAVVVLTTVGVMSCG